jgi:tRNA-specific 2-thiouridylase
MSGGVDSAVAAGLLKERGAHVVGVTMRLWTDPSGDPRSGGCCSLAGVQDARETCAALAIEHYVVDLQDEFDRRVVTPFVTDYVQGRTPNPCVTCNRTIRFKRLAEFARRVGAGRIATGHYARVGLNGETTRWELKRGLCAEKDQSYMLHRLSQEQLSVALFPLGDMPSKAQTRALAGTWGLVSANRPESQDVCFVGLGGYSALVSDRAPDACRAGPIIDDRGAEIGRHGGVAFFTVGQRRRVPASDRGPLYVTAIDARSAVVLVGPPEHLLAGALVAEDVNWVSIARLEGQLAVSACIRYIVRQSRPRSSRSASGSCAASAIRNARSLQGNPSCSMMVTACWVAGQYDRQLSGGRRRRERA